MNGINTETVDLSEDDPRYMSPIGSGRLWESNDGNIRVGTNQLGYYTGMWWDREWVTVPDSFDCPAEARQAAEKAWNQKWA